MKKKVTLFWFRRDLRLHDNTALFYALKAHQNVLPLFVFDTNILSQLDDKKDRRVSLIYLFLKKLNAGLQQAGSSLCIKYGTPVEVFNQLVNEFDIEAVYANRDYEPYAIKRDNEVKHYLQTLQIPFMLYKDQVIFESDAIRKPDGTPYTVFTPYSKRWKAALLQEKTTSFPSETLLNGCYQHSFHFPNLSITGFEEVPCNLPAHTVPSQTIQNYHLTRNYPALNEGTSGMSVPLRFGTVSIRPLVQTALNLNEQWLNELIWREFFKQIMVNFPHVVLSPFRKKYNDMQWRNRTDEFEQWCNGTTGYPMVDAGMRELAQTGLMHNRIRMITAGFLTKHLLIDWRWGEAWFAKHLLDYELSSNNGNWQWAAGCGCDAAPYFRIFHPTEQLHKFDTKKTYVKTWIPEWDTPNYPPPMVEHATARLRAIQTYQQLLHRFT